MSTECFYCIFCAVNLIPFNHDVIWDGEKISSGPVATEWQEDFIILGRNWNMKDGKCCYMAGPCIFPGGGYIMFTGLNDHPNHPRALKGGSMELVTEVFTTSSKAKFGSIPMHRKCYEIFKKVLKEEIDIDILYSTLVSKAPWITGHKSNTNYYELDEKLQNRSSLGNRYGDGPFVLDPLDLHSDHINHDDENKLLKWIKDLAKTSDRRQSIISRSVESDPGNHFQNVPMEILWKIADLLQPQDLISFFQTSHSTYRVARSDQFWKIKIKKDLPWVWELDFSLNLDWQRTFSILWKHSYLSNWWLRNNTDVTNATIQEDNKENRSVNGKFLGLANRRRIWIICEDFIDLYKNTSIPQYYDNSNENLNEIPVNDLQDLWTV